MSKELRKIGGNDADKSPDTSALESFGATSDLEPSSIIIFSPIASVANAASGGWSELN